MTDQSQGPTQWGEAHDGQSFARHSRLLRQV